MLCPVTTSPDDLTTAIEELPWPKSSDLLIKENPDYRKNALPASCRTLEGHCYGFEEAADALVAKVLAEELSPDVMFRPIAFLYRHAIELRLKDVIASGRALKWESPDFPK